MREYRDLAHNQLSQKSILLREFARKNDIKKLLADAGVTSSVDISAVSVLQGTSKASFQTIGNDYSTPDPADTKIFADFPERISNFDALATYVITKFHGTTGHTHDGTLGDGPKIHASNISLPSEAVNGDKTAQEHVSDTVIHNIGGNFTTSKPYAFFDNFEQEDLSSWWEVLSGTPTIVATDTGYALDLPAGCKIRLATQVDGWLDGFTVDYDLLIDPGAATRTFQLHMRGLDSDAKHLIVRHSSSANCAVLLGEDNIVEGDSATNDSSPHHYRSEYYSGTVSAWLDLEGSPSLLRGVVSGIPDSQGQIELEAIGHCQIANFYVVRYLIPDTSGISDYLGRIPGAGSSVGVHAPTHYTTGNDTVDISSIADAHGTLLTHEQKEWLLSGGADNNPHVHTEDAVKLSKDAPYSATTGLGALNGDTLLSQHLRDTLIHGAALASESDNFGMPIAPTIQPQTQFVAARRDHTHPVPCWIVEKTLWFSYSKMMLHGGTSSCPACAGTLDSSAADEYLRYVVPTVAGEYADPLEFVHRSFSPMSNNSGYECHRLRLPLYNRTALSMMITLAIPSTTALWITLKNEIDARIPYPYPGLGAVTPRLGSVPDVKMVDVILQPGMNDLIIYVYKAPGDLSSGFSGSTLVCPVSKAFTVDYGILFPLSIFDIYVMSRTTSLDDTVDPIFPANSYFLGG